MGKDAAIWILFAACLALSFVLSGMEAGVFSLSRLRIRQQVRAGRSSAKLLHGFIENAENFLWTILIGNTFATLVVFSWLVVVLLGVLHGNVFWFVVVYMPLVVFFYAFFDLLPKTIFRKFPNRLCMFFARPFRTLHTVLRPLVALVEWVSALFIRWRGGDTFTGRLFGSREELRMIMQESAQGLSSEERSMIDRVLELQNITVRQIMKPMAQAVTLSAADRVTEVMRLCREQQRSRIPIWEERDGGRRIIGMVNCNELLFVPELDPSRAVREFAQPAVYVDEDMRLEVALRRLQRSRQRLAIVLGRDRRETGVIGLQDILQVIFGEVSL
jgi:CBS domain containing-hemolysin-like protein